MGYDAPGGVTYSYAQLEYIWEQAGGSQQAAPIAAAVAMAESGGVTTATNQDSNGSVDRGLWQINSVHGNQSSYDVMTNARAAVAISNGGTNWSPWTTYTSGAYMKFLQTSVPAQPAPINGTNASANTTATTSATLTAADCSWYNWLLNPGGCAATQANNDIMNAVKGVIGSVLDPIIQAVAGMAGVAGGLLLFVSGTIVLVRQTGPGRAVTDEAGKAGFAALAPEAAVSTEYVGGGGVKAASKSTDVVPFTGDRSGPGTAPPARNPRTMTTVTRTTRRPVRLFGQQLRPRRVTTSTEDTSALLRDEARSHGEPQ